MAPASISVKVLDGNWERCGRDRYAGITPQSIVATANRWGSDQLAFALRRDPGAIQPDLFYATPVKLEVAGALVWSGRIKETPAHDGSDGSIINVACEGWQYHLDDDVYSKAYVHTRLSSFGDMRAAPNAVLGNAALAAAGTVTQDTAITIGYPQGSTAAIGQHCGVVLDLGPDCTAKRIVVTWEAWGADANVNFYARGSDEPDNDASTGGWASGHSDDAFNPTLTAGPTTSHGTFATARRYVQLFMYRSGVTGTTSQDHWVRIKSVKVFADTAYESGDASVLTATQVVTDAVAQATSLLSDDLSQIGTTSFTIPDFALDSYHTPREVIDAVNAYHNWITQIDVDKRMVFKAQHTTPSLEICETWAGSTFDDASSNSGEGLYDKVVVQGTGPDGAQLTAVRTQTAATMLSRRGFTKAQILPVKAALVTASANQIGDTFLDVHVASPFKGAVRVIGPQGVRESPSGAAVHPSLLLTKTAQRLRLAGHIDPITGNFGRSGQMDQVSYDHDAEQADVQMDNSSTNFEAFLERLAVVTG